MMANLFSVFNPSGSMVFHGWVMVMLVFCLPLSGMCLKSGLGSTFDWINNTLKIETSLPLTGVGAINASVVILPMFFTVGILNLSGLIPYVFTFTAHFSVTLSIGLTLWLSSFLSAWSLSISNTLAHLTPLGTPAPLMMFMVLVETVSSLIRPITLAVRLMANMVAGHLLMSLVGSSVSSLATIWATLPSQTLLLILELAVASIQAYVLMTLLVLYVGEAE